MKIWVRYSIVRFHTFQMKCFIGQWWIVMYINLNGVSNWLFFDDDPKAKIETNNFNCNNHCKTINSKENHLKLSVGHFSVSYSPLLKLWSVHDLEFCITKLLMKNFLLTDFEHSNGKMHVIMFQWCKHGKSILICRVGLKWRSNDGRF